MITTLLSTITNNLEKIRSIERKKDKADLDFFKKKLMNKLLEIKDNRINA
jgi:hypothetical protein